MAGGAGLVAGTDRVLVGAGLVAGTDRVQVGTAVAVEESVGVEVGSSVEVGVSVGVGSSVGDGSSVNVGVGVGLGVGVGSGPGESVGPGSVGPGSVGEPVGDDGGTGGVTAGEVPRGGFGTTGGCGARGAGPRSVTVGPEPGPSRVRRGAAGSQPLVGPTLGEPGGGTEGWLVIGIGISTGPTDGVGMNGMLLSGSAVLPGVAEPALIAARIGIDAVPASSATVSR
ncbi:hypothetical protein [Micromonospora zamorensis]|uniref:hypothetical protein n=1 Tax=Micromonospora zamorensis TaxID=709883 RepID=UPI0033E1E8C2